MRFGVTRVDSVDLRGTRVGAVVADVFEYAFAQEVTGRAQRSFLAAASEGDSDERALGLAVGPGGALWVLVNAAHAGDPNVAIIHRLTTTLASERLVNAAGPGAEAGFRAIDLAVDGTTLYLVAPGVGVVAHPFAPAPPG